MRVDNNIKTDVSTNSAECTQAAAQNGRIYTHLKRVVTNEYSLAILKGTLLTATTYATNRIPNGKISLLFNAFLQDPVPTFNPVPYILTFVGQVAIKQVAYSFYQLNLQILGNRAHPTNMLRRGAWKVISGCEVTVKKIDQFVCKILHTPTRSEINNGSRNLFEMSGLGVLKKVVEEQTLDIVKDYASLELSALIVSSLGWTILNKLMVGTYPGKALQYIYVLRMAYTMLGRVKSEITLLNKKIDLDRQRSIFCFAFDKVTYTDEQIRTLLQIGKDEDVRDIDHGYIQCNDEEYKDFCQLPQKDSKIDFGSHEFKTYFQKYNNRENWFIRALVSNTINFNFFEFFNLSHSFIEESNNFYQNALEKIFGLEKITYDTKQDFIKNWLIDSYEVRAFMNQEKIDILSPEFRQFFITHTTAIIQPCGSKYSYYRPNAERFYTEILKIDTSKIETLDEKVKFLKKEFWGSQQATKEFNQLLKTFRDEAGNLTNSDFINTPKFREIYILNQKSAKNLHQLLQNRANQTHDTVSQILEVVDMSDKDFFDSYIDLYMYRDAYYNLPKLKDGHTINRGSSEFLEFISLYHVTVESSVWKELQSVSN